MTDDTASTNLPELRPLTFGEIFSHGWSLLPRTLPNAGLLGLLIMIPFTWLSWVQQKNFLMGYGEMMAQLNHSANSGSPDVFLFLGSLIGMFALTFLGFLLYVYLLNGMVAASWEGFNGRTIGIGTMLREAGGRRYWYSVVQFFMIMTIFILAYFVVVMVSVLLSMIAAPLMAVVLFAFFAAAIYFMGLIVLSRHEIMLERRGPWRGLIASINLVKGNWLKTIALILLLTIPFSIIGIAAYIPVIQDVMAFMKSRPDLIKALAPTPGTQPDQVAIASLYKMLAETIPSWIFPIIGAIQALWLIVLHNGLTALYVDLRTRRGDFNAIMDEDDLPL